MASVSTAPSRTVTASALGGPAVAMGRILLVEPSEDQRAAMASALQEAGYEVRAEPDGRRIEQVATEFRPHLAVLNVRYDTPPCGYMMTRILRRTTDVPALLVLRKDDAIYLRVTGLKAGADQFIFHPFSPAELVARVQAMLRRTDGVGRGSLEVGDLVLDERSRSATRNGVPLDLTQREFELLLALVRNRGRVVPKERLSTLAWGTAAWGPSTLPTQISSLRKKLEAHGTRLIHTAHRVGYVLRA